MSLRRPSSDFTNKKGGKRERGLGQYKGRSEVHINLEMVKKFQARFCLNPW